MTKNKFFYKNIFIYSSFQFSGNIEEYFSRHSEKLMVFIILPRGSSTHNFYRLYKKGILVHEKKVISQKNILLYYLSWYITYVQLLLKYFKYNEKTFVISFHPLSFFFMSIQKLLRKITFVYWVGDFFPGNQPINFFYRQISFFYNKRIIYRCYLSDRLNKRMNKKLTNTKNVKTVMWGVKPAIVQSKAIKKNLELCFVGVIRESQGIEFLLELIAKTKNVNLKLLGPAPKLLADQYNTLIQKYKIMERVYFPNKTLYGKELENAIKASDVGVALYDEGIDVGTYYADPAKVKTYAQYGLPILMTNASDISSYIKKFHAGEVVKRDIRSMQLAISRLRKHYTYYIQGLRQFSIHFNYEVYYKDRFTFLETK